MCLNVGAKKYGTLVYNNYTIICETPNNTIDKNKCGIRDPPIVYRDCTDDSKNSSCCYYFNEKKCFRLNYRVQNAGNTTIEVEQDNITSYYVMYCNADYRLNILISLLLIFLF
jgi:hypothetical protein